MLINVSSSSDGINGERQLARRVLVCGDDTQSFLATVRSFGRAGLEVHAAPFNFEAVALKSRYIKQIHWLPYYSGDGTAWLHTISALLREYRFDLVVPCDERVIIPLHFHQAELKKLACLAIPGDHAFEVFFDKVKTRELAISLGMKVPAGRAITADDSAPSLICEAGLPLAIKPRSSYALGSFHRRAKVHIVHTETDLRDALLVLRDDGCLYEQFVEGTGVGVSVLASRGALLQVFEHHRVHELDGSAFYRVSAQVHPDLLDTVEKMVAAVKYTGVAMFEFRVNQGDGTRVLLEVNARPWGSLPLPVALGVDFPYRWYRLLVEHLETPPQSYRAGIYGRNSKPDLVQLVSLFARQCGVTAKLRFSAKITAEFSRILVGREVNDLFTLDDPAPGLEEIAQFANNVANNLAGKIPGINLRRKKRDRQILSRILLRAVERPITLTFICQGNVWRSPFAAALLGCRLQDEFPNLKVESSGILPRIGRNPVAESVQAAQEWGIDITKSSSQHLSPSEANLSTVLVAFDDINLERLGRHYPVKAPVILLGSFSADNRPLFIDDPVEGDLQTFLHTYSYIDEAVAGLASFIRAQFASGAPG